MNLDLVFSTSNIILYVIDAVVLGSMILYMLLNYRTETDCREIQINKQNLRWWRYGLYGAVLSAIFASYYSFVFPNLIKITFHMMFLIGTLVTLNISLPAWMCKKRGIMFHCNCDYYQYQDFLPMILVGLLGSISFLFLPEELTNINLFSWTLVMALLYNYAPTKPAKSIFVPDNLSLTSIDQLQAFLMVNPNSRKLITLVHGGCDFCELQINEIEKLAESEQENTKVLDLTNQRNIDQFLIEFLNLGSNFDDIPFPSTLIIDNGLSFDRKDGVLTANELAMFLMKIL